MWGLVSYNPRFRDVQHKQTLVTPSALLPVPVDDVRRHLDLDCDGDTSREAELEDLIREAAAIVEHDADIAILDSAWTLSIDHFPCEIEIWRAPVTAIDAVKYRDVDGTLLTLSASLYQTDLISVPARIRPTFGNIWPTTIDSTLNAVTVEFTAGYDGPANVPRLVRTALLMAVSNLFHGCAPSDSYWSLLNRISNRRMK